MTTFVEFPAYAVHRNFEVLVEGKRYGDPAGQVTAKVTKVERKTATCVELGFANGATRRLRLDTPVYVVIRPGPYEHLTGQPHQPSTAPNAASPKWDPPEPSNTAPAPFSPAPPANANRPARDVVA